MDNSPKGKYDPQVNGRQARVTPYLIRFACVHSAASSARQALQAKGKGENLIVLRLIGLMPVLFGLGVFASAALAAEVPEPARDTVTVVGTRDDAQPGLWGGAVPALALAQSISSTPASDVARQGAMRVEDLAGLVPGLQAHVSSAGLSSAVYLRGFAVSRLYFNGQPDVQRLFTRDLATVERVDVLSGPAGLFYGLASPGGVVEYVGKRPRFAAARPLQVGVDTQGIGHAVLDATGPLGPDVAFRAVLSHRDGKLAPAALPQQRSTVMAALAVATPGAGQLNLEAEATVNRTPFVFGTVITGAGTAQAQPQYDRLYVVPGGGPAARNMQRWAIDWQRALGPDWKLQARYSSARGSRDETLLGFWTVESDTELSGYYTQYHDTSSQQALTLRADGTFAAAGTQHRMAVGLESFRQQFKFTGTQNIGGFLIDVARPDFSNVDVQTLNLTARYNHERGRERAAWLSDHITLTEGWFLSAGARHTNFVVESDRSGAGLVPRADASGKAWHLGTTLQASARWAGYVSTSTGFEPNRGVTRDGLFLPPQRQRQLEVGTRFVEGQALSATMAAYRVDLSQVAITDPADRTAVVAGGARRVEGVQATVQGRLMGVALDANMNWLRMRRVAPLSQGLGDNVPGVARQTAGVRISGDLVLGSMPAKWLLSASAVGRRAADGANTTAVAGYGLVHAAFELRATPTTTVVGGRAQRGRQAIRRSHHRG